MHTLKGETCTIFHHGDYHGEIHIVVPGENGGERKEVHIDAKDVFLFVAEAVRTFKMRELEEMNTAQLLARAFHE